MAGQDKRAKRTPTAAVVTSAVKDRWAIPVEDVVEGKQGKNPTQRQGLETEKLMTIIQSNAERINDSQGIRELLPDLNLVGEILVASILSPKDLREVKLKIKTATDIIPNLAEVVREHLTSVFNLEGRLSEILSEALYDVGSHTLFPLPPTTIHNIIKRNTLDLENFDLGSLETIGEMNIGVLANKRTDGRHSYAMEGISAGLQGTSVGSSAEQYITLTDNPHILLKPTMIDIFRYGKKAKILEDGYGLEGISVEARRGAKNDDVSPYIKRRYRQLKELIIKRDDSIAIDKKQNKDDFKEAFDELNPVVLNIPAEAIIPVHVPGEPERHVGYYIAVDKNGNPIQRTKDANYFSELNRRLKEAVMNKGEANYISNALGYTDQNMDGKATDPLISAYERKLEEELIVAVKDGIHGDFVEISAPEDLYRTMFARQLSKMKTTFVYVPAEMLTYFAFNYNAAGIGISLIEKTKLYSSLRAIMMFANVMAGVKNSVGRRVLNITLDENDPDPQKTVETILNEFVALQTSSLPLGKLSPADIVESLQRAGIQVKVDGGEVFPTTSLDLEERQRAIGKPDTELDSQLKIMHYAGFGINPEAIDKSLQGDFATGLAQADLLQTKRIMVWQKIFTNHLSDFVRKYIFAGGPLYNLIKAMYNEVDAEEKPTLQDVIEGLEVLLPAPDTAIIGSQSESFDKYESFIDRAVGLYINEEMIGDMVAGEEVGRVVANVRASVSSHLKRQYMRQQNMLPELDKLFTDEEADPTPHITQLNEAVVSVTAEILKRFIKDEKKADKKVITVRQKLDQATEETPPEGGGLPEGQTGEEEPAVTGEEEGTAPEEGGEEEGGGDFAF